MIFCFFNGEVISLMKRMLKRRRLMSSGRHGGQANSTGTGQAARTFYTQSVSLIDTVTSFPHQTSPQTRILSEPNGGSNNNTDQGSYFIKYNIYIYIYVGMCVYVYMCVYIQREIERLINILYLEFFYHINIYNR